MGRRGILERIVEESAGRTVIGQVSASAERIAEEMAQEWLADEKLRREWREFVQRWTKLFIERLVHKPPKRTRARKRRRRPSRRR